MERERGQSAQRTAHDSRATCAQSTPIALHTRSCEPSADPAAAKHALAANTGAANVST